MGVVGAGELVVFLGPLATYRQNLIDHIDIRQMFVDMITTKAKPKRLLGVVVHVVITMPSRTNGEVAPISKQAGAGMVGRHGTIKKIEIVVPSAFEYGIGELYP